VTGPTPDFSIADLELSVRTSNVLRVAEIESLEAFMALTKPTVMGWQHAGARTWKEISEMQEYLRALVPVRSRLIMQAEDIERLHAALRLVLPVLEAAVSFERAAADYLTESQYEFNTALSEHAATIFVNGNDALQAVRAVLEVKP